MKGGDICMRGFLGSLEMLITSIRRLKDLLEEDISTEETLVEVDQTITATTKREFFIGMFNTGEGVYLSNNILSEADNLPKIRSSYLGVKHVFEFDTYEQGTTKKKRLDCYISEEGLNLDELLVITGLISKVIDRMPQGVREKVYKRLLGRLLSSVSVKENVPTEFMRLGYLDLGATNLRSRVVPLNTEVTEFEVIE